MYSIWFPQYKFCYFGARWRYVKYPQKEQERNQGPDGLDSWSKILVSQPTTTSTQSIFLSLVSGPCRRSKWNAFHFQRWTVIKPKLQNRFRTQCDIEIANVRQELVEKGLKRPDGIRFVSFTHLTLIYLICGTGVCKCQLIDLFVNTGLSDVSKHKRDIFSLETAYSFASQHSIFCSGFYVICRQQVGEDTRVICGRF